MRPKMLDEKHDRLIAVLFKNGKSVDDIAQSIDVSVTTIANSLHRSNVQRPKRGRPVTKIENIVSA